MADGDQQTSHQRTKTPTAITAVTLPAGGSIMGFGGFARLRDATGQRRTRSGKPVRAHAHIKKAHNVHNHSHKFPRQKGMARETGGLRSDPGKADTGRSNLFSVWR
ncbi:ABC transporter [Anopheles sinensis]|uniref:ABC transporter n=1 Tax=Anopheles sinensis TaxID=74873 RepID=A0A084WH72_ANOSI|nr:ABC transporter [Anopheles sinensis]